MRNNILHPNPEIDYRFAADDLVAVIGTTRQIEALRHLADVPAHSINTVDGHEAHF